VCYPRIPLKEETPRMAIGYRLVTSYRLSRVGTLPAMHREREMMSMSWWDTLQLPLDGPPSTQILPNLPMSYLKVTS
jgi:hypothetical protein